ncbi:MAG: DNA mismatch repair endonuclease MutL [Fidelibacterota bacterium]
MMSKIKVLSDDLKNKIAAGEVVERPASVVKELIENSIDAGATSIEIVVEGGGNVSIQVIDDGEGLSAEDLVLAFARHSTSKINKAQDLERISTLGFRGEALASIASVAKVKALSATNSSGSGYVLTITDGTMSHPVPSSCSKGTAVTVSELFFSVPARRKFLKSPKTELRHLIQSVKRFALCNFNIGFRLVSDEKVLLDLPVETVTERIGHLFDPTYKQNILPVRFNKEPFRVEGYIGNLNLVRKRRGEQYLFLNGRWIRDRLLDSAVFAAYRSLVLRGEFPFFVLNLEVPLEFVDVNVHPMKTEVRFRDEWKVYHVLKSAVVDALQEILATIPDFSPPDTNYKYSHERENFQAGLSFKKQLEGGKSLSQKGKVERAVAYVRTLGDQERRLFLSLENIWQIHEKYIISQITSGLVIIDQHVAHERILYEQALAAMEQNPIPSQTLLFPQVVEFSPDDYASLIDLVPYLEKIGFRIREFGKTAVLVEGVPQELGWGNESQVLREIIDYFLEHQKEYASFQEAVAASYACKAAIKAGDTLAREEMQNLVDRLFATKHPYYCPHGRPIIVNLSLEELDKRFERS